MPRILVTNDDGIYSEGLAKLAEAVRPLGDVVIVAPDREQSAASHALTLNRPLRLQEIGPDRWIVDGTPTDCVNLALLHIFRDQRPDLVVSGINFGPNMGDDVTYSGTISAAFEGSLLNVPSIAFSAFIGEHFDFTAHEIGVDGARRPRAHQPGDPEHVLGANPVGEFESFFPVRIADHLRQALAVSQVDENHAAMVAAPVGPAGQRHDLADQRRRQFAAVVASHTHT